MSFGRYLKAIRERQGIPLEAVAEEICVSARLLSWIEAEDHERMPKAVYTKGILRSYAKAVGVDPDDIVERYQINLSAYEQALRAEAEILTSGRRTLPRMLIALFVLGLIIAVSLYGFNLMHPTASKGDLDVSASREKPPEPLPEPGRETAGTGASSGEVQTPAPSSVSDSQLLVIDAVSEVTLNVQLDGRAYTKYRLDPNDHVELEAESYFNILISDAAGVRLRFNGEPVRLDGAPGQSVNILLPNDIGNR